MGGYFMDNIALWILIIVVIIIGIDCVCGNGRKMEGFDDATTQQGAKPTPSSTGYHCNVGNGTVPVNDYGNPTGGNYHVIVDATTGKPMKFATKDACDTYTNTPMQSLQSKPCRNNVGDVCMDFDIAVGLPLPETQNSIPVPMPTDTSQTLNPNMTQQTEINNTTSVDLTWLGWLLYFICCASPICICLISFSCGASLFAKCKNDK